MLKKYQKNKNSNEAQNTPYLNFYWILFDFLNFNVKSMAASGAFYFVSSLFIRKSQSCFAFCAVTENALIAISVATLGFSWRIERKESFRSRAYSKIYLVFAAALINVFWKHTRYAPHNKENLKCKYYKICPRIHNLVFDDKRKKKACNKQNDNKNIAKLVELVNSVSAKHKSI